MESKADINYRVNKGATLWFTGFSGAGKSTLSNAVREKLH